jgi:hypothetical protein
MKSIIENLATFADLNVSELGKRGRQLLAETGGLCHRLGKLICVIGNKAERGTVSAQKFVTDTIKVSRTDIPAQAWSVANCCTRIGEGSGFYSEAQLDLIPARWLAVASAILNLAPEAKAAGREVNGKPFDDAAEAAHLECMAAVIRTKPKGGQDRLETLRDQLKPAKADKGDGEGTEGEGTEGGESGDELTPAEIALATLQAAGVRIGEADFSESQAVALLAAFKALAAVVKVKAGKPAKPAKVAA